MALARKQPFLDIHALDLGVVRGAPDMDLCAGLQQVCRLRRRRVDHVVEVHLVQPDCRVVGAEELFPHRRQREVRVRQFPGAVGFGFDRGAERAAEDLVPEADPREFDVWAVGPDVWGVLLVSILYIL